MKTVPNELTVFVFQKSNAIAVKIRNGAVVTNVCKAAIEIYVPRNVQCNASVMRGIGS